MAFVSETDFKKTERFLRKILETFKLKLLVYLFIINPVQQLALYRLNKKMNDKVEKKVNKDKKKIIFHSLDARYMPHTYIEAGIAKSLQLRGHEVKMVICAGALSMCTTHFSVKKPPNKWSCSNCVKFSKKFYDISQLPYHSYNDFIKTIDIEKIKKDISDLSQEQCEKYVFKDVNVGSYSVESAQRYFQGEIPSGKPYEQILKKELVNAIISTVVAEHVYKLEKPDILFSSHGCYSSWGSFSEYMIKHNVKTFIWLSGENNTLTFSKPKADFFRYYNEIRNKKMLNKKEQRVLADFINKRTKGEEGQVALYGFSDVDKKELDEKFDFKKFDKTYVLFPNVPWDIAAFSEKSAFEDIYEWISYTIDIFKEKANDQLIIKIHPSETKVMESKRTVLDYINDKYPELPENIKIIPPDTTISPYSLFPYIDIGIVFTGTIGLEMTLNEIPVIAAGNAHYRKKGFTFDIDTKKQYKDILFKEIELKKDQIDMVKVYSYFYFIKNFVPRDFIYHKNFLNIGWNIKDINELSHGHNKHLDHICDFIINEGVYQGW